MNDVKHKKVRVQDYRPAISVEKILYRSALRGGVCFELKQGDQWLGPFIAVAHEIKHKNNFVHVSLGESADGYSLSNGWDPAVRVLDAELVIHGLAQT